MAQKIPLKPFLKNVRNNFLFLIYVLLKSIEKIKYKNKVQRNLSCNV